MFPHGADGRELVARLRRGGARAGPTITVLTNAEVVGKSGTLRQLHGAIRVSGEPGETIEVEVGQIVVATGFDTYEPAEGEFGYGDRRRAHAARVQAAARRARRARSSTTAGRSRSIAYVYCVGSRSAERPRVLLALLLHRGRPRLLLAVAAATRSVRQYHLYRDLRTYGEHELAVHRVARAGLALPRASPTTTRPRWRATADGLTVTVRDLLTAGEELDDPGRPASCSSPGMVPRRERGARRGR